MEEIQCMIENTDYTLIVSYLDEDADEVEQAVLLCRERKPLGLLFLGGNPEYFKKEFAQVDVPCVLVTNLADQMDFQTFLLLRQTISPGCKMCSGAVICAGHTKIGILGGDIEKSYTSHQRFIGCQQSFLEHDTVFVPEKSYEKARFSYDSAYRGMKRADRQVSGYHGCVCHVGCHGDRCDPCTAGFRIPCAGGCVSDWI